MKIKKLFALVLSAAMAVTVFTGCGNNGGSDEKRVKVVGIELTQEEYAFGVDKSQDELLAQLNDYLKEIKESGQFDEICNHYFGDGVPVSVVSAKADNSKDQLVVATNAAFEPFEYTKGDAYLGIDMEIMKGFAEKLGKELVIQNMDFEAVCLSVGQQKCDVAASGLTIKEDRKEYVTFTNPYYNAAQKIVVMENNTEFDACKTKEDVEEILKKKTKNDKVGVQNGTTGQFYCKGDAEWGFEGYAMETVGYKNGSLAIQDLVNGNLNYVVIDSAPAKCIAESINKMQ